MEHIHFKRKDGYNLGIIKNNNINSFTIMITINVGGMDEKKYNRGISHFVEHMLFKGTKKIPITIDLLKKIENIGGNTNAFTDYNETCYYIKVPYNKQFEACKILLDMVFNSIIPANEFEKERNVVIEEILKSKDDPEDYMYDIINSILFKNTSLEIHVAGSIDSVKKISRNEMLNFIKEFYIARNTTILIYGKIQHKTISFLKQISLPNGMRLIRDNIYNNFNKTVIKLKKDDLEQSVFSISFVVSGSGNKEKYALSVLSTVLGGNMSSRLYLKLREEKGLVYNVSCDLYLYPSIGYICINGGCHPKNTVKSINIILNELKKIKTEIMHKKELDLFLNYMESTEKMEMEDSDNIVEHYTNSIIIYNSIKTPEYTIGKYRKMTPLKIKTIANKYLTNNMCIVVIGNHKIQDLIGKIMV